MTQRRVQRGDYEGSVGAYGKDRVLPLLEKISSSLKPDGMAIIDVPNMDWILGQHERYMDFTHEVGFTRESLAQ